jgi:PAS domain S-box-containing protein
LKVVLILGAALATIIGIHLVVQHWVIQPGFVEVETRAAGADVDRCVRAVEVEIERVDRTCHDWAAWDDMYANALAPSEAWTDGSIGVEALRVNSLELEQIVGVDGRVVWQQAVDLATGRGIPVEGVPTVRYPTSHPLLAFLRHEPPFNDVKVRGIAMVGERPLLVASRPIVTTNHQGPLRGALILGHYLADEDVRRLSEQTRVAFAVTPAAGVGRLVMGPLERLDRRSVALVERLSPERLRASRLLRDLDGRPALVLGASVPRDITHRGSAALRDALVVTMTTSALLFGLGILVALRVAVLRPLWKFTRHARAIEDSGDYSARLALDRRDEIGILAKAFDRLMSVIESDIKHRQRTEEQLRKFGRLNQILTESVGDLVAICDASGNFIHLSPSYQTVLGYELDALLGRPFHGLVYSGDQGKVSAWLDSSRNVGGSSTVHRMVRRDGGVLWFETFCKGVFDIHEHVSGWVFTTHEITERRRAMEEQARLEDQLRQSQKMEAVGRLAGGVAHDFNNLVTGITLTIEMLMMDRGVSAEVHKDLIEIKQLAERAAALTAQLLAFSRKQVIAPKIVDLNALVAGSVTMLKRLIGEDIELVFTPDERVGRLEVDPTQMEQVLVNLAVNARDAMPAGGRLTIETDEIDVDDAYYRSEAGTARGRYARCTIRDTGLGMDEATRSRIFEPFFTTKDLGKGTGLGLSTVYGIVEQNRGFITVDSEVGVGTVFSIHLPVVAGEAPGGVAVEPETRSKGCETILLVEDEQVVLKQTRNILEREGYRVLAAERGDIACSIAATEGTDVDLLLTDVVMPGMNGRQVYEALRERQPELRVLFMSGYAPEAIARHGVIDEGTPFIQKPFDAATLARRVREALDA